MSGPRHRLEPRRPGRRLIRERRRWAKGLGVLSLMLPILLAVEGAADQTGRSTSSKPMTTGVADESINRRVPTMVRARSTTIRVDRSWQRGPGFTPGKMATPEPPWLSECTDSDAGASHPNGQVPGSELCRLPTTQLHQLHSDAARGWNRLNLEFTRQFGTSLCVTDSYRSLETQASLYATKPGLAATPGRSNHGWGLALDLCGGAESFTSREHQWLRANGGRFGWANPTWASPNGSRPEPWHWEFSGA